MKYTVLLLYPEYIADSYGESYMVFVDAKSVQAAVQSARRKARRHTCAADDMVVVAVLEGAHPDVYPHGERDDENTKT